MPATRRARIWWRRSSSTPSRPATRLLNPTALKRAVDTGGASLLEGVRNLAHDLRHNKGLPSSVDKSAFAIGRNLCLSPGSVVFRNEVLELIQYKPTVDKVYAGRW